MGGSFSTPSSYEKGGAGVGLLLG